MPSSKEENLGLQKSVETLSVLCQAHVALCAERQGI